MKKLAMLASLASLVVGISLVSAGCGSGDDTPKGAQLSETNKTMDKDASGNTVTDVKNDSPKGIPGGPHGKRVGG